jgi:hypothetical protein
VYQDKEKQIMECKRERNRILITFLFLVCLAQVGHAAPMGTAFTYQGRLIDANEAADGSYDFLFRLFDAASGGNMVVSDVNFAPVEVIDGYFTIELDLGSSVFAGSDYWLEIGVRQVGCGDPHVTLSPRQRIAPTPYALYALDGGAGGDSPWQVNGSDIYYSTGNVGIGGSYAPQKLTVHDGAILVMGTQPRLAFAPSVTAGSTIITGVTDGSFGSQLAFVTCTPGTGVAIERMRITGMGNVGIGTTTPAAKLTVHGAILKDGSTMYGANADTHINLGLFSTTGTSGQDWEYITVSGGSENTASARASTVGGGAHNHASSAYDTVGGGWMNTTSGSSATVGGGRENHADGLYATVAGGGGSTASGWSATVAGGYQNNAVGDFTFAAGRRAKANHQGTFVWADSTDADFISTAANQFLIRASGGVGIGTTSPARKLHVSDVMRLQPRATPPGSPAEGDIYMNSSTHKLMVYDGTTWKACW